MVQLNILKLNRGHQKIKPANSQCNAATSLLHEKQKSAEGIFLQRF